MYEELVKRLRAQAEAERFYDGEEMLYEIAADAIEELSHPKWIPVTERLPEEKHAVIVWEPKYLNHYICVLYEGEWYVFGGYGVKVFGVTHWMPLPPQPKEET